MSKELIVWDGPPERGRPFVTPEGRRICGAKLGNGYRCESTIVYGNGRCKFHGGASTGPAIVHGRRSKYAEVLRGGLADDVREFMNDPEIISVREDIALVKARIREALQGMPSADAWAEAFTLYRLMIEGDEAQRKTAIGKLGAVLENGMIGSGSWNEVERLQERARRLVDTENRIATNKGQVLTKAALLILIVEIQTIIETAVIQEIANPHERQNLISRIFRDFGNLVSRRTHSPNGDDDEGYPMDSDA